ncbi:hypothetical protein MA13_contig00007-0095 [Edwardsiella piscicida]|uniref:Uncharacterized protein n=1 Tax=Edwardsiella anguillarum ET080813 TaxID=667120 RepID=A0A076LRD2_9GAMM|nr:Hypothetical protein ETEE_2809 [Edwardsiella anguillarum ET080813]GAJ67787.1 hypothetical protein MA13_contig00007-0095 [Edwardsiella piscicida]
MAFNSAWLRGAQVARQQVSAVAEQRADGQPRSRLDGGLHGLLVQRLQ